MASPPRPQRSPVAIVLGLALALLLGTLLLPSSPLRAQLPPRLLPPPVHPSRQAPRLEEEAALDATVIRVADGDSIKVRLQGQARTVRLACIDAPELDQPPWGAASRAWLQTQLPPGTSIRLRPKATDRYGRLVAEVIEQRNTTRNPIPLNRKLVEEGQAFVYPRHVDQCDAVRYREAQDRASGHRVGVWQEPGGIERPWEHRQRAREPRPHRPQPLQRPGLAWKERPTPRPDRPAALPPSEASAPAPIPAPASTAAPPAASASGTPPSGHRSAPAASLRPDRPRPPTAPGSSPVPPLSPSSP